MRLLVMALLMVFAAGNDPAAAQATESTLESFIRRLKSDPPPWDDVRRMRAWLASYGKLEERGNDRGRMIGISPPKIEDADSIFITLRAPVPGGVGSEMVLKSSRKALEPKIRTALTETFGDPDPACLGHWRISSKETASLLSHDASFSLVIYYSPDVDSVCK